MVTGKQIKDAIKAAGYTMEKAADLLEVSRQTLYGITNRGEVSDDTANNVITKLKLSLQNSENVKAAKEVKENETIHHPHPSDAKLIAHLEKSLSEKDAEIMWLREELKLIKDIQLSLDEAKKTQLRISAMNSAFHEKHLELLADKKDQNPKKLLQIVHRNATQKWTAAEKMGNLPGIDI